MSEFMTTIMNGAKQIMRVQAINANNMANASTDGFRAEVAHIMSLEDDNGLRSVPDLSLGVIRSTGRSLDVAVDGKGWIAVMTPEGTEGYSRRGDLRVDALGQLTNGVGQPVLGNQGPIALPPFSALEIGKDGSISIIPQNDAGAAMAVVDRIRLVDPDENQLYRGDDGILRIRGGGVPEADAEVRLISGSLEGSNVNAVGEMVKMIDLARRFEAQIQLMQAAKENASRLATVMGMQ